VVYQVGICEDRLTDREYISKLVYAWAEKARVSVELNEYDSCEQFLFAEEDVCTDILLLDIELGKMDGMTMARKLREKQSHVQIIFTTGYSEYISEGYEVSALHYLMKPVQKEKLFHALDRAVNALDKAEPVLLLPVDAGVMRIVPSSIMYVEAFLHYVSVTYEHGTVTVKYPISKMEELLGAGFVKCHRSYLVSLKHISQILKTELVMDDGTKLPLSRSASTDVYRAFISYHRGKCDETV